MILCPIEKVLSFKKFVGRHCAKNIQEYTKQIIKKFGIFGNLMATTTDDGPNIHIVTTGTHVFGVRIHCFGHALNLTIMKGLNLWRTKQDGELLNESVQEIKYVSLDLLRRYFYFS